MRHASWRKKPAPSCRQALQPQPEEEKGAMVRFLFVGERPSHRAEKIGATWQNGKLAGKTLRDALLALHLDPEAHRYVNLYPRAIAREDQAAEKTACREIARYIRQVYTVIGLGGLVSSRLNARGLPHLKMIHPAARGAIRRRDRYQSHVGTVLLSEHRSADRRRTGGA